MVVVEGAQHGRREVVEMIESAFLLAVAAVLALALLAGLLTSRPAHLPVPVRIRTTQQMAKKE